MESFYEVGFDDQLLDGIEAIGYLNPTPIQALTIPLALEGRDLIGCAQTGTGKTAAYLLPVMNRILQRENRKGISALIIAPTRELAMQIDQQVTGFSYFTSISSLAIYGGGSGESFDREKKALSSGADIIIATPGRLLSHLSLGYCDVKNLQTLVLDEADRMLDMGFYDDLMRIVNYLPKERQTLMFSATMPPKIRGMAQKILNNPAEVNIAISKPAAGISQKIYAAYNEQKLPLLLQLLQERGEVSCIIFASTKQKVKEIERLLKQAKVNLAAIHSDLEQKDRENALLGFRNKSIPILVATDVMSRGIDIENLSLVVNFDVPSDGEDYVHRVGRTARAASTGEAITFVNPDDMRKIAAIERLIGYEIQKMPLPEALGAAPEFTQAPAKSGGNNGGKKKFFRKGKGKSKPGTKVNSNNP